ncbi:ATP-binding protein [Desulfoluna spongiiphila]|uniref:ATP-binding protein n=1 Tax=Desulfoluna spongiiphila TaxID=419481 RepID=UPI00125B9189|nr:4Fe-4S binding protein [Desulfoluna spongiiphila]VVS94182.1 consensus disorder prediction [Desulfoluna spongiiphila]
MISRREFIKFTMVILTSNVMPWTLGIRKSEADCGYDCSCGGYKMYYIDNSLCVDCGTCAQVCPVRAVTAQNPYEISDNCIGCGACEPECPVSAIFGGEKNKDCDDPHGDKDRDGLTNEQECEFGSDPCSRDTDGDGLTDLKEYQVNSFPRSKDTDNDGFEDNVEFMLGTDLRDRNSKPSSVVTRYSYDVLGRMKQVVRFQED